MYKGGVMTLLHDSVKQINSASETNQEIYDFLKANPVGVLATVDPNGDPHATVVYFSVNDDFEVSFTTKRDTQKHDNIQHHNHVQLAVYEAASQTIVQITGEANDITDSEEAQDVFKATIESSMRTSLAGVPPVSKLQAGYYVAYRMKPKQIRMAVFSRPRTESDELYKTIDF